MEMNVQEPKKRRGFLLSKRKRNLQRKNSVMQTSQGGQVSGNMLLSNPETVSVIIPEPKSGEDTQAKRKTSISPGLPKKRPFLKVSLSFLSSSSEPQKSIFYDCPPDSPSAFESELSDQENQSPNDPDFIRRASYRWKQKNGIQETGNLAYGRHGTPSPLPVDCLANVERLFCREQHIWCQKHVHHSAAAPLSNSFNCSSSVCSPTKTAAPQKKAVLAVDDKICDDKRTPCKPEKSTRRSFKIYPSKTEKSLHCKSVSLDDTVAHVVMEAANRKTKASNGSGKSMTLMLNQLHLKQGSLGTWRNRSSSFNSFKSLSTSESHRGGGTMPRSRGLKYCSKSYHSGLSDSTTSDFSSGKQLSFEDIFVTEPAIAEKFAIMFPSEPRPEWHRHLRQILQKAGQKIFKKPEHHDTNIPENLRYQLKQIYVY